MSKPPKLLFIQLNEVNFDVVRKYLQRYELPAFRRLFDSFRAQETFAEADYSHLEPWIQWVSAHTGKTFREHGIFRLGDMADSSERQIFELLEEQGLKVGAISPMNSRNELRRPAYFIPDPWTQTPSDDSGFSRRLTAMLRQTVNENAQQRVSLRSLLALGEAVLRTLHPRRTLQLLRLVARSRGKPWNKAMVLDHVIHMVHMTLLRSTRPDVSFVFLNAGAHVQHHYFLCSEFSGIDRKNPAWYAAPGDDPILEMLRAYDHMLADYLALEGEGASVIVATGLTQVPYDRVKFYYRLRHHEQFLAAAGVRHAEVLPRMTRDFEIVFASRIDAETAARRLASMRLERDGRRIFEAIEDRGLRLFVTLSYPDEIESADAVLHEGGRIDNFRDRVAFVAIKNGMHSGKGFALVSPGIPVAVAPAPVHVASLFDLALAAAA